VSSWTSAATILVEAGVVSPAELDFPAFQAFFSESYRPPPAGTTEFQKPLGLAIRRLCAPLLDLEPSVSGEAYVERRLALGAAEVNRRLLRAAGLDRLLIDSGLRSSEILSVAQMGEAAGRPAHEVVRIESVIEEVARSGVDAAGFPAALAHRASVASHAGTDGFLRGHPVPEHTFRQWLFGWHDPDRNNYFKVSGCTGWGMTEMVIPAIAGDSSMEQRALSVGRPYPGYTVRVEHEDGSSAGPGETGHLLIGAVRGLSIFQEYVDNPRAMAEAFDARGFFRTGDRVTVHEDGWIQFKDRIKDMIKVGGESVSASEVEAAITEVGGVAEVAVVARPDGSYGEVAVAFVVLEPQGTEVGDKAAHAAAERIAEHCRRSLAKFKQPRDIIITPALPKIGNNKINRPALRELAAKPGAG